MRVRIVLTVHTALLIRDATGSQPPLIGFCGCPEVPLLAAMDLKHHIGAVRVCNTEQAGRDAVGLGSSGCHSVKRKGRVVS